MANPGLRRIARSLIFAFGVACAGCGPLLPTEPPAETTTGCQSDDDCRLSTVSADTCCDRCDERAVTRASHEALRDHCAEHPPSGCPSLDCPDEPAHAACVAGRCERVLDPGR